MSIYKAVSRISKNKFLINKTLPLSISMPSLIIFFVFTPKSWVLSLPHAKKKYWWLRDQGSRRRRRRLQIKELISPLRSKELIKIFKTKVFLEKKNFLWEKKVWDRSWWISVEVRHVCRSTFYESEIIRSGEYLPTSR